MPAAAPENELNRLRTRVAELEKRVAELETSIDSVPVLISYFDTEERYRRVNRAYEDMFQVRREDVVGRSIQELTGEPHYSNARAHIRRALAGERVTFESQVEHRDGTLHEIDVTYSPHFDSSGRVQGVVVCVCDVSEERRAQNMAKARERDLLSLLSNVPNVICRYNRDLRIVFVSASIERHTGYPPEYFTGKSFGDFGLGLEVQSLSEDALRQVLATGELRTARFEFQGPNGLRQYEVSGAPEFAPDGSVASVLTIAEDITQRLKAEEELRRSKERQRLAVEAGKVGLWHWDIEANNIHWSDLIYELHGLPKDGFGGRVEDFAALVHPEDRDLVSEALSSALAARSDYHVEFRALRPDGSTRWIFTNGRVVFDGERPVHMLGAMLDMTETKAAAEALERANEELRRANENLNQFAYSASHDLKEPLRMIALYGQLLQRKFGSRLDGDGPRYVGYVIDGAERMDNLLRDLLAYTEAITAGTETPPEPVDLHVALEKVRANLAVLIQESGAVISSDPLPVLQWREAHAIQVLQNLLGNAIKYRDPERTPVVHLTAERHLRCWQIAVSDNSIGVDPRYHDRIFGMFKRLHTADKYEGTGIGLAICQKVIERNGGRIWIESEPGRGSTFYFTCPAA